MHSLTCCFLKSMRLYHRNHSCYLAPGPGLFPRRHGCGIHGIKWGLHVPRFRLPLFRQGCFYFQHWRRVLSVCVRATTHPISSPMVIIHSNTHACTHFCWYLSCLLVQISQLSDPVGIHSNALDAFTFVLQVRDGDRDHDRYYRGHRRGPHRLVPLIQGEN